jgi:CRP/FNR family cyclic AMP-dependent transcriptional regulator
VATDRKLPYDPGLLLARASDGGSTVKLRKNEALFAQGNPADSVFYILDGKVKVIVLSEQGKEAVVAILGAGDFCGEGSLGGQAVRMASAVAMNDGAAVRLQKTAVIRLIREEPEFSKLFTAHLLARNIRAEADLVDHLFNSSEKRLARLLLILANFGKEGKPEPIIPLINQETLAEMIGTTRSRVSHFMNKFRQLGFIDYNGHLEIHSSLLSVILHDHGGAVEFNKE